MSNRPLMYLYPVSCDVLGKPSTIAAGFFNVFYLSVIDLNYQGYTETIDWCLDWANDQAFNGISQYNFLGGLFQILHQSQMADHQTC